MKGVWLLSWRQLGFHRRRAVILVACIALAIFLPIATQLLIERYERDLVARSEATPLIAGAKGNRFDLVLSALYFRESELDPIPYGELDTMAGEHEALAVPLHVGFTARGIPVAGTSREYYEQRGLALASGSLPLMTGDVLLGAGAAAELGMGPGDALHSDQKDLYDISVPPALKMSVCGVLAPSGTPDDHAVFVDVRTSWVLEGLAHGHLEPSEGVDPSLVLGQSEELVVLSPALIEHNEVTPETVADFHFHGDIAELPLTAILAFPKSDKAGTILKARVNARTDWQMEVPRAVIDDLMAAVFRIKAVLDGYFALLGISTALLTGLVLLLSMRLRAGEMLSLHRIGCSRHTVAKLYATELGLVLGTALVAALGAIAAVLTFLPNLIRTF